VVVVEQRLDAARVVGRPSLAEERAAAQVVVGPLPAGELGERDFPGRAAAAQVVGEAFPVCELG